MVGTRIIGGLDIAVIEANHRALGLLGVEREREHAQLPLGVARHEAARLIHAGRAAICKRDKLLRLACHEQPRDGKGVYADVEHRAAGKLGVVKAIGQVAVLFEAAEIHLREVHLTELARVHAAHQLLVQRHVQNGGCVHKHHAVLVREGARFVELGAVERDGLLAQHVLARSERLA